jgi:hypothetical protein
MILQFDVNRPPAKGRNPLAHLGISARDADAIERIVLGLVALAKTGNPKMLRALRKFSKQVSSLFGDH